MFIKMDVMMLVSGIFGLHFWIVRGAGDMSNIHKYSLPGKFRCMNTCQNHLSANSRNSRCIQDNIISMMTHRHTRWKQHEPWHWGRCCPRIDVYPPIQHSTIIVYTVNSYVKRGSESSHEQVTLVCLWPQQAADNGTVIPWEADSGLWI